MLAFPLRVRFGPSMLRSNSLITFGDRPLKLAQLRNLVAVANAGSVRQASRDLHLSQSAITKSIKGLEDELCTELFYREAQGVSLTASGRALVRQAKLIEAQIVQARREVAYIEGAVTGEIRVAASPTVATNLLPNAIVKLKRNRPSASFHIEEGVYPDILPRIRGGDLDFAICLVPEHFSTGDLVFEVLIEDSLIPAVRIGHPLTYKRKLDLGDLLEHEWVVFGRRGSARDVHDSTFRLYGYAPPPSVINCFSFVCAMTLVAQSDLIVLVPTQIFSMRKRGWPIVPLRLQRPLAPWTIAMIARQREYLSPICKEFARTVRQAAESITSTSKRS
jgi:LysR family transcriptional regulator of abg operon